MELSSDFAGTGRNQRRDSCGLSEGCFNQTSTWNTFVFKALPISQDCFAQSDRHANPLPRTASEAILVTMDAAFPGRITASGLGNHTKADLIVDRLRVRVRASAGGIMADLIMGRLRVRVRTLADAGIMTANRQASVCQVKL